MFSVDWFFSGWSGLGRVIVVSTLAYVSLVFLLRVSGKRTLSKMNAFDLVVTVALGSILATVLLSKDVALAEGITAMVVLIGLQFIVAWLSQRFTAVSQLVKSKPTLLLHRGEFLADALRQERVTENEVRAAVRNQGLSSLEQVLAVILETDGSLNVIPKDVKSGLSSQPNNSAMTNVRGHAASFDNSKDGAHPNAA